jgi:hypothetical protein
LDLLVEFHEVPGLFEFIALENHLADMFGVKVDLVMPDALKARVSRNALKEKVAV